MNASDHLESLIKQVEFNFKYLLDLVIDIEEQTLLID